DDVKRGGHGGKVAGACWETGDRRRETGDGGWLWRSGRRLEAPRNEKGDGRKSPLSCLFFSRLLSPVSRLPLGTRYSVLAVTQLLDRLPAMLLNLPGEHVLDAGRVAADDRVHVLAVHEEQDAGNRPHVEPDRGPLVGIGIQLGDLHLAHQFIGQLVDGRRDG